MSKTKKSKTSSITLSETIQNLGLLLMSAALTVSVFEVPDDAKKVVLPTRPAPVWAEAGGQSNDNNPIRREREDTTPHYISYSEVQRTPSRSGRS